MPHFRPGLWPSLAAIVVIVATALLGNWQHNRASYKADLQARAASARAEPPLTLRSARDVDPALRYRPVEAEGEYAADGQIWLDNRTYRGTAGYYVLTPLRMTDGTHILVNRGWIAAPKMRDSVPAAPPPSGPVRVIGTLNAPPPSFLALSNANVTGAVWQNLDLAQFSKIRQIDIAPLVIEQAQTPADGLVRDWPVPDFGRETNVGYMWQWWSFGALALVLWIVLGFRAGRAAALPPGAEGEHRPEPPEPHRPEPRDGGR